MKDRRFLSFLLLALLLAACSRRADEVREGALARVQHALELARQRPGMIGNEAEAQAAWTKALLALDEAAGSLSACPGKGDECLAAGLSCLLNAERELRLVEQLGGVARLQEFADVQRETQQAAELLYTYFYGEASGTGGGEWRGPPTPRPPGVCPGG
ncbi:MAG: hypothetical protein QHJ81_01565 [Anaerolineae bacterium]|nr:hypothetical protein [Anaerolineae bacterium]